MLYISQMEWTFSPFLQSSLIHNIIRTKLEYNVENVYVESKASAEIEANEASAAAEMDSLWMPKS